MKHIVRILPWCVWLLSVAELWPQSSLADASIEDLLKIQVTSVSKKEQTLARTAASVYVMGSEEIRRSGVETLPDLLRRVPGVDVSQINASAWAISIRGMNGRYSNKVLVLVDGRAVYNTTFGGVYWDQIDLPLEVIERVEVVRGSGGTVWGANAVNGVINLITRSAAQAQGGLVSQSAGLEGAYRGVLRYGGPAGSRGAYTSFASWAHMPGMDTFSGAEAGDAWGRLNAGFRGDWQLGPRDSLTLQGDGFRNRGQQNRRTSFLESADVAVFTEPVRAMGANLLGRWTRNTAGGGVTNLQVYFDGYRRRDLGSSQSYRTADFDLQHHFHAGERQEFVISAGYRSVTTGFGLGGPVTVTPSRRTDTLFSASLQDEVRLGDTVWVTIGSKLEHNSFTGLEYEPGLRVAWAPGLRHTIWAAAARAIRQPARIEDGVHVELAAIPLAPSTTAVITLSGDPEVRSERLSDFEAGYRAQWTRTLSFDIDAFYSRFRGLLVPVDQPSSVEFQNNTVTVMQPLVYANLGAAANYGGELMLSWTASSRWRPEIGYANLHQNGTVPARSIPGARPPTDNNAPRHSLQFRSCLNLTRGLEWSQSVAIQSRLAGGGIAGRTRMDTRLALRVSERVELSVIGQNLYRPGYVELNELSWLVPARNERRIFGKVAWSF